MGRENIPGKGVDESFVCVLHMPYHVFGLGQVTVTTYGRWCHPPKKEKPGR